MMNWCELTDCRPYLFDATIHVMFRYIDVANAATGEEFPDRGFPMPTDDNKLSVDDHI